MAGYLSRMLRPAFLAGQWYPDDEGKCRAAIEGHAADARPEQGPWRGLIAPHAGWTYSGDAAARGFRWLAEARNDVDLVVVFGSHRGATGPNTILRGDGWETPLGVLQTAQEVAGKISATLDLDDEPLRPRHPDNAAEILMPFVRHFFPEAELVMLGVESANGAITIGRRVSEVVAASARNAVYVGSTDLTHYGPNYRFEPHGPGQHGIDWVREKNDRGFIDAVLAADGEGLVAHASANSSACCSGAVAACLAAVAATGDTQPKLVDHYLSCDVRPSSSFVGYAGILL